MTPQPGLLTAPVVVLGLLTLVGGVWVAPFAHVAEEASTVSLRAPAPVFGLWLAYVLVPSPVALNRIDSHIALIDAGADVVAAASVALVVACSASNDETFNPVTPSTTQARVRVFNATNTNVTMSASGQAALACGQRTGWARSRFPRWRQPLLQYRRGPVLLVANGSDPAQAVAEVRKIALETGLQVKYVVSPGGGLRASVAAWRSVTHQGSRGSRVDGEVPDAVALMAPSLEARWTIEVVAADSAWGRKLDVADFGDRGWWLARPAEDPDEIELVPVGAIDVWRLLTTFLG